MKKYAIVCGSRTGSTYLCNLLTGTNRCGYPQEYFNKDLKFPYDKHELIKKYKTENDVWGVKVVGFDQINSFYQSNIQISHWIWLYREDKVLQAISRYRAFATNGWHRLTPTPEYSFKDIKWCLDEIEREEEFFADFFENKDYLKLQYEIDICENSEQTVISTLHYLHIKTDDLPRIVSVRNNTELINYEWKIKFNEENRR